MKGYVKKIKAKRMLATLLTAVMVISLCMPQNVEAGTADDRYKGSSTIQSLLTDFEYVVRGNVTLTNSGHCVGAAAIGGSLTGDNSIGDGAKTASYAKHIVRGSIGNGTGFVGTTQDFYYGSSDVTLGSAFTYNPNYIDIEGMFPSIISQSEKMAYNSQNTVASYDENESAFITVDFTKSKVYNISYDDLYKAEGINVIIDNVDDFSYDAYTINVIGVGANRLDFNCETDYGAKDTSGVDFKINGSFGQFLMNEFRLDQQVASGQSNVAGMKFIWNFPDATDTISWSGMPGHLVAPKAHVEAQNRFEGGVIAASVYANGQAHFFPYGDYQLNNSGTAVTPKDIMIKKLYLNENYITMTPTGQAKFTLFTDEACQNKVPNAIDIAVDEETGCVTFDSETLGLQCGKSYYAKETYAPTGFDLNDTVYECAISAGGQITYKVVGSNSAYSSDVPVCENYGKTSTPTTGTIFVAVVEKTDNGTENVKGATVAIELKDADNNTIVSKTANTSDADYVSFKELPSGTYTIKLTTIPQGYKQPSANEREVVVKLDKTAYHTFELEKTTAPVVVKVVDKADQSPISGGIVQITGPNNYSRKETVGSTGTVTFEDLPAGDYKVTLVKTPTGYNDPNSQDISFTHKDSVSECKYELTKQVGKVVVEIVEEDTGATVNGTKTDVGGYVTITYPDGTVKTQQDTDKDGIVIFTDVPVGTSKVQIEKAPNNYVLVDDNAPVEVILSNHGEIKETELPVKKVVETGDLTIKVIENGNESATYTDKVTLKITGPDGVSYEEEATINGSVISKTGIPVGTYTIAVKTPEGWKTIETTVDNTKQPNAVNVNATVNANDSTATAVVVKLETIGSLKVIVKEKGGNVIPGATVVVKDSDGVEHTIVTGDDGSKTIKDLPAGTCEDVTVSDIPTTNGKEYEIPADVTEPTITKGAEAELVIEVEPYGKIIVEVKEQGTNKVIEGASITISGITTPYTTDANGKVTVNKVSLGDYTVEITDADDIWVLPVDKDETVSVTKDADGTHTFYVTQKTGTLTVSTVWNDNGTNTPLADCTIKIVDNDGKEVVISDPTTAANGKLVVNNLPIGEYKITIVSAPSNDYILPNVKILTGEIKVKSDGTVQNGEVEFVLTKNVATQDGALKIAVFLQDGDSKKSFDSATVDLYGVGGSKIGSYTDDETEKDTLTPGYYKTSIVVPDGYALAEGQSKDITKEVIGGAEEPTYYEYVLVKLGKIEVTVKDSDNNPVKDVVIAVVDKDTKDVITTGKTEDNGKVTFDKLPSGDYDLVVKEIPEGYGEPGKTTETTKITLNADGTANFELPLVGKINVLVYKEGTTTLVGGANISLDATTNNQHDKSQSAAGGQTYFDKLCNDSYQVKIENAPAGYMIVSTAANPSTVSKTIDANTKEHEVIFYVKALGGMQVTVVEDSTGNGVDEVEVEIKDAKGNVVAGSPYKTVNGMINLNNLPVGKYTLKVVDTTIPANTKLIKESEATKVVEVLENEVAQEQFKIIKTTTLIIDIVDETNNNQKLDGSKVMVEDQYGNKTEVVATNGTVTLPKWPITTDTNNPTKVTITKVPSTHVIPNQDTTTVVVEDKTENKHVVDAPIAPTTKADFSVTVRDEVTNEVIPNASIEITYPDGTKELVNTDANGKIEKTDVITGKYKFTVNAVPQGYTKPSNSVTVLEVKVGQPNSVEIVIRKPVNSGSGTAGIPAPSTPSKSSNAIIQKAPKTGDTGYIPFAIAMMAISMLGLAGIVVYRKKTENER